MKRSDTRYRSLKTAFREYLTEHDLWPLGKEYTAHMQAGRGGVSGKTLTEMRAGGVVPERAVKGLVTCMLDEKLIDLRMRDGLRRFVQEAGGDVSNMSLADIVETIADPSQTTKAPPSDISDDLQQGVRLGPDLLLKARGAIVGYSRDCTPSELPHAVEWLHVFIARSLLGAQASPDLAFTESRPIAEGHMGIGYEDYIRNASAWSHRLPMSVRLAMGRRRPVGFSVVLPIDDATYDAIRSGRMASYDCEASALRDTSRNLLIEACAERVAGVCVESINPTRPLLATLLVQLACLSGIRDRSDDTSVRLLSFAGTSESRARLAKQGFAPTGATMPRSGVEIMEREFRTDSMFGLEALTVMVLRWLAKPTCRN